MSKTAFLAVAGLSLTACTDARTTPLADMSDATVQIIASNGQWRIDPGARPPAVDVAISSPKCPTLSPDATASIDGRALEITNPGGPYSDVTGSGCDQIRLRVVAGAPRSPGTTSVLTIADASATWTIAVPDLEASELDIVKDAGAGRILVTNRLASSLSTAYLVLSAHDAAVAMWSIAIDGFTAGAAPIRIDGNHVVAELPSTLAGDLLSVRTTRAAATTRCEGPAACSVTIEDNAELVLAP